MSFVHHRLKRQSVNGLKHDSAYDEKANSYEASSSHSLSPNIFQAMILDLLDIEGYNEKLLAIGSNIPLQAIESIRSGLLKTPDDETVGKLLKFYNKIIYEK